jgi:hypothetical protein
MEEWEHLVAIFEADGLAQSQYLQARWPQFPVAMYDVKALIPLLDYYGKQGWELASAQPVVLGGNQDVSYTTQPFGVGWTHTYLCFFKRRKQAE